MFEELGKEKHNCDLPNESTTSLKFEKLEGLLEKAKKYDNLKESIDARRSVFISQSDLLTLLKNTEELYQNQKIVERLEELCLEYQTNMEVAKFQQKIQSIINPKESEE